MERRSIVAVAIVLAAIVAIVAAIRIHRRNAQKARQKCGACAEKQKFGLPLNNLDPSASTETPVINTAEYMPARDAYTKAFAAGPPYDGYVSRPPR